MILRIASILFPISAIVGVGYRYGRRHDPGMAVLLPLVLAAVP